MASENKAVKTQDIKQELIVLAKPKTDIFIFAERYYNTFHAKGKHGTFAHYKSVFSKLKTYLGDKKLLAVLNRLLLNVLLIKNIKPNNIL